MQITITISDKIVKAAVENMIDGNLYENYDRDVCNLAGVPKKATLVKAVLADEKFMAALTKEMQRRCDLDDYIYDYVWDVPCKIVTDLIAKCDDAYEKVDDIQLEKAAAAETKRKEAEEAATVARVIEVLKKQGYSITKA
jgi:hypothetical protein